MLLSLREIAHFGTSASLNDPNRVPIQYEVQGLPYGEQAWIAQFDRHWEVLRATKGIQGNWQGQYQTPDEALIAIQSEID